MTHLSFGFLCGRILNYTKKGGYCYFIFKMLGTLEKSNFKIYQSENRLTQSLN